MNQGLIGKLALGSLDRTGKLPALENANDSVLPGNADLTS
jgi:hypothetical protein